MSNNNNEAEKPLNTKSAAELKEFEERITADVLDKIKAMQDKGLMLPPNYSAANAVKTAFMMLFEAEDKDGRPILSVVSQFSVGSAILKMLIQGMTPAKNQCYFFPKGGKLKYMRSYEGSVALAKRVGGVKEVTANVVYAKDKFAYGYDLTTGRRKIFQHDTCLANVNFKEILGGYAVVELKDGTFYVEVMTMAQIEQAWRMGSGYGKANAKVYEDFKDEMCNKTTKQRACKHFINTSDDSNLYQDDEEDLGEEEVQPIQLTPDTANKTALELIAEQTTALPEPDTTKQIVEPLITAAAPANSVAIQIEDDIPEIKASTTNEITSADLDW